MSESRSAGVRMLIGRLRHGGGQALRLLQVSVQRLFEHHGTQLAASMAYYALFSIFPAAIVAAAVAGSLLDDPAIRADAIDYLVNELPLNSDQGRSEIERAIDGVTSNSGTLGLIGGLGLLVTASALMSAARNSLNIIFGGKFNRGALRGKGLDILLIATVGGLLVLSFAATLLSQLDLEFSGRIGRLVEGALNATGALIPLILAGALFAVLYRYLPVRRRSLGEIWPGVIFAAVGYELLKLGFSLYLDNFANYDAVYGSLGAVIAFLFFIYLAGIVFLLGAEIAASWPALQAGEFDPDPDDPDERSLVQKVIDLGRSLFAKNEVDQDPDAGS